MELHGQEFTPPIEKPPRGIIERLIDGVNKLTAPRGEEKADSAEKIDPPDSVAQIPEVTNGGSEQVTSNSEKHDQTLLINKNFISNPEEYDQLESDFYAEEEPREPGEEEQKTRKLRGDITRNEEEELQTIKGLSLQEIKALSKQTRKEYLDLLQKEMKYFQSLTVSEREYVVDQYKKARMYTEMIKTAKETREFVEQEIPQKEKTINEYQHSVDTLLAGVQSIMDFYADKNESRMKESASENVTEFKERMSQLKETRSKLHNITLNKIPYQRDRISKLRNTVVRMEIALKFVENKNR